MTTVLFVRLKVAPLTKGGSPHPTTKNETALYITTPSEQTRSYIKGHIGNGGTSFFQWSKGGIESFEVQRGGPKFFLKNLFAPIFDHSVQLSLP